MGRGRKEPRSGNANDELLSPRGSRVFTAKRPEHPVDLPLNAMPLFPETLVTPVLAFVVSALSMPVFNRLATARGFVDIPNARKIHSRPIPMLGGLAVYLGVIVTLLLRGNLDFRVVLIIGASLVVMLVGVLDDRLDIHSRYRLLFQAVVALGLSLLGVRFNFFPGEILDHVVTVAWIVGVINAMNCLDCADGAAGGTCAVVFAALALLAFAAGRLFVGQAALAGLGAVAGFLVYNAPPARVFLGDAGSTFLGLMAASLTIVAAPPTLGDWQLPLAPILLAVPVFDILWVHARRYQAGIRSFRDLMSSTGKDHLPHRLMGRGLSSRACALVVAFLSLLAAAAVVCLTYGYWIPAGMAVYLLVASLWHIEENAGIVIRPGDQVSLYQVRNQPSAIPPNSQPEESVA